MCCLEKEKEDGEVGEVGEVIGETREEVVDLDSFPSSFSFSFSSLSSSSSLLISRLRRN